MSLYIPYLYHWSPVSARANIAKRGLLARTPTAVAGRPQMWQAPGHHLTDDELFSAPAVRLGTSPGMAWRLSAAFEPKGSVFDLWEVDIAREDECHPRAIIGWELDEVAVLNDIPVSRIWWVGARVVGARRLRNRPGTFALPN